MARTGGTSTRSVLGGGARRLRGGQLTGGHPEAGPGFPEELEFCVFSVKATNVMILRIFSFVIFFLFVEVRPLLKAVLGCGCRGGLLAAVAAFVAEHGLEEI